MFIKPFSLAGILAWLLLFAGGCTDRHITPCGERLVGRVVYSSCAGTVVQVVAGRVPAGKTEARWESPEPGAGTFSNVFVVSALCALTAQENQVLTDAWANKQTFEFAFDPAPENQECAICFMWVPLPSKYAAIQVFAPCHESGVQ